VTSTTTVRHELPTVLEGDVDGDLRGRAIACARDGLEPYAQRIATA
jgi:hypothetical protein